MKPLSLVLPCYNEALSIEAVAERAVASARKWGFSPEEFRLILVDNGSTDDTAEVIARLRESALGRFIDPVHVPVNRGYGYGILQGLLRAPEGVLAWSHADEQCDPDDVFRAWDLWKAGGKHQLVKGRRVGRELGERAFSLAFEACASAALQTRLHEINAQPKVFDHALLELIRDEAPWDFSFDLYVLLIARRAGYKIREIEVKFPPRPHGQSHWAGTLRSRAATIARTVTAIARMRRSK